MARIGVAVPTYNRETQLNSLLEVIPEEVSVYVSDNGSHLSAAFMDRFPKVNFQAVKSEPVRMFANWNIAARMVKEEWVVIPSDDDIYFENSFRIITEYIERYNTADIIVFGHQNVDENYHGIGEWKPRELVECIAPSGFEYFKYGVSARMPSVFFKRKLLEELGFFDEKFKLTAADSDLIQRALIKGRAVFVPKVVSGYRVWMGGATYKTISTLDWMEDINYWGEKIEKILQEIARYSIESSYIRAELYASNLVAGVRSAKKQEGYVAAWEHMKKCRYPHKALLYTKLRLLYWLIKP